MAIGAFLSSDGWYRPSRRPAGPVKITSGMENSLRGTICAFQKACKAPPATPATGIWLLAGNRRLQPDTFIQTAVPAEPVPVSASHGPANAVHRTPALQISRKMNPHGRRTGRISGARARQGDVAGNQRKHARRTWRSALLYRSSPLRKTKAKSRQSSNGASRPIDIPRQSRVLTRSPTISNLV